MKKTDWILLFSYLGINLIVWFIYFFNLYNREFISEFYFVIPLIYVYLIFDIFHKQFWNKKILLIWGVIGITQLIIYYTLKDLPEFQAVNGNYFEWLKALPITILVSFTLNLINQRIYGDNFIVTSMRLNSDRIDPKDGRKLRPADYIFSLIGYMAIIFGVTLTK